MLAERHDDEAPSLVDKAAVVTFRSSRIDLILIRHIRRDAFKLVGRRTTSLSGWRR